MKKIILFFSFFFLLLGILVYISYPKNQPMNTVAFMFPDNINDQTWGTEGYKAMQEIAQKYDANLYFEQNVNTESKIERQINLWAEREVNIIYGQGSEFEKSFNKFAKKYPNIHFVFLNGESQHRNVTAINIDGYAQGFFAGIVASRSSHTGNIGVIGAFKTQPEIKGFIQGAHYDNPNIKIIANYVGTWSYFRKSGQITKDMIQHDKVDVVYPAADGVSVESLLMVKAMNKKAIGYIMDQSHYGDFVLTSTIQNISTTYQDIADKYVRNNLLGGTKHYGMSENISTLGPISKKVDLKTKNDIATMIKHFKETNLLPDHKKLPQSDVHVYTKQYNLKPQK
ncbi:BMP family ABC transporter substrate-binding protein [Macrococcus sp. DPC7161]|uniref:BMP family ABC transporter substrate-binding protein n=1 Tax=Macrococcus sp. DPC7161 TaxID=2507060 RepID=UPI0013E99E15|nr:BMP family ABC transporter substrate-binding protein [Macrococcus sp. DPC7161]